MKGPNRVVQIHGYTLAEFAVFAGSMTYRPVIDKTGIAGRFDFHLEFAPDDERQECRSGFPIPARRPSREQSHFHGAARTGT